MFHCIFIGSHSLHSRVGIGTSDMYFHVTQVGRNEPSLLKHEKQQAWHDTHIRRVLFDLMVIVMVAGDPPPPEAVLAEVVVGALLALVTETSERIAVASLALHRVKH